MRKAAALLIAVLVAAGSAYGWWRWRMSPRAEPLEVDWEAVVTTTSTQVRFSDPFGIAAAPDGSLYVADAGDAQAIRRIAPDGRVTTIATAIDTPSAIAVDAGGVLYVAETGGNAIVRIARDETGQVQVSRLGAGAFNGPVGVAVAPDGRVIVADTYNDRVQAIGADGTITTLAGPDAGLDTPCGVAVDGAGNVYVADTGRDLILRISPDGATTFVGPIPDEGFFRPIGIAATSDGVLYVTDERGRIIEIRQGVRARVVAGSRPGYADGPGREARFRGPSGVAVIAPGRLAVTDTRNALVRFVEAGSQRPLRPPASPWIAPSFDADAFNLLPLLWPFESMEGPYEITGTMGEVRGGDMPRFHAGLDISGDEGMDVLAVRDGVVRTPVAVTSFDTLSESIRIGPVTYVHLRVGRLSRRTVIESPKFVPTFDEGGRVTRMRVRRGTRFRTGERIGTLNQFNHAHLNVGWPVEEHNPLRFRLVNFVDTVAPTISPFGVRLFDENGLPVSERDRGRLVVRGPVRIVVDAWDQVDGNEPRRRLGLHTLGYQLLRANRTPAPGWESPRLTMFFDQFSADGEDAPGMVYASGSGIPFYGNRRTRFLFEITNTFRGGVATRGTWDPTPLEPGDYLLRVIARDINGNEAGGNRDVLLAIPPPEAPFAGN